MTIAEALRYAARRLGESGVAEHAREANSLLRFITGRDRAFFVAHPERELTAGELSHFKNAVSRRAKREPLQYITGKQEFFGRDFLVTPDVLIPRPETEMLVQHAIEILRDNSDAVFAEVGVGSGCIAVSILAECTNATAAGLDISPTALAVAKRNATAYGVNQRLELLESDLFAAVNGRQFTLIVSNPPYVPLDDLKTLQAEVSSFEPRVALTDGGDGLSIIRRIIDHAPGYLRRGGVLLLEIGMGQAERVLTMFDPATWCEIQFHRDFQDIPRIARSVLK
ncbi:MAG: peptide chain release factor N(5)-glutamine methyltransferase [Pyrinomonadaceae bacterium]